MWAAPGRGALTLRVPWGVPLGRLLTPSSSCISKESSSSSSSKMSERSEPRLLSVWYSSPWQQCGWGPGKGCRWRAHQQGAPPRPPPGSLHPLC